MLKQKIDLTPLLILREAFNSLLPIVLVMNILVLLSALTTLLSRWGWHGISIINGNDFLRLYHFLLPLFVNLSLSTLLAKKKGLDQIGTLLIAMICFFRVSGFLGVPESGELTYYQCSILMSIPLTWLTVSLLKQFSLVPRFKLVTYQSDISPRLKNTFNLIIPGLLTVICFELLSHLFTTSLTDAFRSNLAQAMPTLDHLSAWQELILYKFIGLCAWFVGLHGEHTADGVLHLLHAVPAGNFSSLRLKTFHDIFMNIGGSGATFVIPILLLLNRKTNNFKSIARLSLPFSFFNVNEILLFGLPILLNPVFFIPFLLAPFVNMAIALSAMHFGLFSISPAPIHWMSMPLYSAYIASGHSISAVVTQFTCIVADGFIYLPFLLMASRQHQAPIHLLELFGEDAYGFINEEINKQQEFQFVAQQREVLHSTSIAQQVLQQLRDGQFTLYFQPKFDATSLRLVGLEALLRFRNSAGKILPPTFLPVLYEQGLSQVIDKKVVDLVFDQVSQWRRLGLPIPPIAINFDKDFLLDRKLIKAFIARAKQEKIHFYIEITEHTYTVEVEALSDIIRQLRAAGHCISIDDFGAGYSSLTTLLALEADEIKLDRQLVISPDKEAERGFVLLATSIQLCHDLGFSVVAEGVETEAQMQLVRRCGADVIQGYYLGKPMAADSVGELFPSADVSAFDHAKVQQAYMEKQLRAWP